MTAPRSTEGLLRSTKQRSTEARSKIRKAVREMKKKGLAINPHAVSQYAKVARKTIYNHTDLLAEIQAARDAPAPRLTAPPVASGDTSITTALREQLRSQQRSHKADITALKAEITQLKQELAAAHGEIHRLRNAHATRQQA